MAALSRLNLPTAIVLAAFLIAASILLYIVRDAPGVQAQLASLAVLLLGALGHVLPALLAASTVDPKPPEAP